MRQLPSGQTSLSLEEESWSTTCWIVCGRNLQLLLNEVTSPVPDVRDYIVTPAVAGNGSATLGTLFYKRSEREA